MAVAVENTDAVGRCGWRDVQGAGLRASLGTGP